MASLFRAPLYTPRGSRSVSRVPHTAQTDVWANRLVLFGKDQFFAAPGMAPTYDWPNPLRRDTRFPIENRSYIDPFESWLLKDKFFGGPGQPPSPFHQPNPRGYPYPIDGRTWTQALYLLNGKDQFFGAAGESATYDWPNPLGRAFPLDNRTEADATEFWLLVQTAAPFAQTDWPNPSRLAWSPETRSIAAQSPSWIFQPPQTIDWPNPSGPRFPLENRTQADATEFWLLSPAVASPFAQTDWPNPKGARGIDARTWAGSLSLLGKDQFFGATGESKTYDWPNPRGASFALENRTEADGTEFWLLVSSQAPFTPIDWPNPAIKRPAIDTRTHLGWAAFGKPAAQTDWPNPQRPRLAIDARTALNVRRFWYPAPSASPFSTVDWHISRRIARPLTWTWAFPTRVLAAPRTPDPSRIFAVDDDGRVMLVEVDLRTLAVDSDPRVLLIGPDTWSAQTHNHVFSALVFDPRVFDV